MIASMGGLSGAGGRAAVTALVFVLALTALALGREGSGQRYELSAAEAIAAAQRDPDVRAFLADRGFTRAESIPLDPELRRVAFFDGQRVALDAAVDSDGMVQARQEHRPGLPQSGSRLANSTPMLVLFTCLFLLVTLVAPARRLRNLDALALASLVAWVVLTNERLAVISGVVAAVPLIYLTARCAYVGLAARGTPPATQPLFLRLGADDAQRGRLLGLVTGATALAFLGVTLTSSGESDVATASLSGATELLEGRPPYGNIVEGVVNGDTYPLLAYISYIPGALLSPVTDAFSDRSGALVVAAIATAVTAWGLYRLVHANSAQDGSTAATLAVLAWLAFPPVLLTASGGSNDMVLAAALVWAVALAGGAARSSLVLTAAVWTKVVPLVLAPLWLARLRGAGLARGAAAALGLSAALGAWLILLGGAGAVGDMAEALVFQLQRRSFYAPWEPLGLGALQVGVQAGLLAAVAWATLRERVLSDADSRDLGRLAAVVGALLLWSQLSANYWTWAYLPWAVPFVIVALLSGGGRPESASPAVAR